MRTVGDGFRRKRLERRALMGRRSFRLAGSGRGESEPSRRSGEPIHDSGILLRLSETHVKSLDRGRQFHQLAQVVPRQGQWRRENTEPAYAQSANRAKVAFRQAASALLRSQNYLGAQYRRLRSRLGAPKAITAMARKLACLFYRLLKYGQQYSTRAYSTTRSPTNSSRSNISPGRLSSLDFR
jgi:hypothetical protein